jgi:HSP20 family protein
MMMRIERFPVVRPAWHNILNLERELESLFGTDSAVVPALGIHRSPLMNVAESEKETVVTMELPGIDRESIKIAFEDGVLSISGERKEHQLPEGARWVRNETYAGNFRRAIRLTKPVNAGAVTAELKNGVLRVVLPTAEEARAREISIR